MRIVFATDGTGSDALAARHAAALTSRPGTALVTIHVEPGDEVADELIERLRQAQPTFVVLGTHARHGADAVLRGSVAGAVARNLGVPTLIVPNHGCALVDDQGAPTIQRVLVPTRDKNDARRASGAARVLLDLLGSASVDVEVTDEPLASIIDVAAHEPSLIAMATRGHDSIGDVLRGSHTERVVRDAKCPVLCVPA